MKKQLLTVIVLFAAAAGGFVVSQGVFAPEPPPTATAGTTLPQPRPLPEFSLPTVNGEFTREDLTGTWSLVFFGFTNCPDVCPNTLFMLDKVVERFDAQSDKANPQVVFISVDPQRDDPATTAQYAHYFNEDFVGVSGQAASLDRISEAMSVAYGYEEEGDSYTVVHSSTVILIDPQGRMHTIFTPPLHADKITADLINIIGVEE
ncbi:MAG: SCO family protein [Gammaproteobacteria bacterium]|nr:SCO family protein [Gammaproteobacteria bacterium]